MNISLGWCLLGPLVHPHNWSWKAVGSKVSFFYQRHPGSEFRNCHYSRVKKLSEKGSSLELIEKAKSEAFTQVFNLNLEIASISYSV